MGVSCAFGTGFNRFMTDYGTIKIPTEEYERHNEQRKDMGLSWAEYIDGQAPEPPDVTVDVAQIATRTADEIDARLR